MPILHKAVENAVGVIDVIEMLTLLMMWLVGFCEVDVDVGLQYAIQCRSLRKLSNNDILLCAMHDWLHR
jgi:hypothetical protein